MKQRVRVVGVIRREGRILLLRRAMARSERPTLYELPTGRMQFGEQPEEAMARIMYDYLGVRSEIIQLDDVITFTNLRGASELANLYIVYRIGLEGDSVKITTERYDAYKWLNEEEVKTLPLDEASLSVLEIMSTRKGGVVKNTEYRGTDNAAIIYTDGGSRGNPGPSGVGYYILGMNGAVLKRGGEFLGFSTSRVAEYYGLKEGVEQAIELGLKAVHFKSDSLMMVNQMNGVYKVKNRDLMNIYDDIWKLLGKLESYSFEHVSRDQNREADAEVNKIIDAHLHRA